MAPHKAESDKIPMLVSSIVSVVLLISGLYLIDDFGISKFTSSLLLPISRLILLITIGLVAGQIIESTGWTKSLAVLARPVFKFSNLGNLCSVTFTTALFSGVASNAMLLSFYKDDKISKKQLYLTNLINQLPAYFLHLPSTVFVIIPLTGLAGFLYFILTLAATILRTFIFIAYGHIKLQPPNPDKRDKCVNEIISCQKNAGNNLLLTNDEQPPSGDLNNVSATKGKQSKGIWHEIRGKMPDRIINICVYVIPIYISIFVINSMGFFDKARQFLAEYITIAFLPVEALSVVILSFFAEFTSGFASAGALKSAGLLTTKQTVLALIIGNIVAFPIRTLRHQLPRYIGIFSPKMGTELLLLGQGFRIISLVIVGIIYLYIF